jgi:uncharacterized protein (TIGR02466 family)
MHLDNWFPSTIGRQDHPEWLEPMTRLFDRIFKAPDKDVNTAFYHNGETTYGKYSLTDDPDFAPFVSFIKQRAFDFLELQGYDASRVPWKPYFFANSFREGSNHPRHLHSQCTISGIYYLTTPPGSSNIIFYPNQPFKDFFDYMFFIKDPNNWHSMSRVEYQPSPGLLLMWPAWLYHEVPPNQSQEPRTSIVFNL